METVSIWDFMKEFYGRLQSRKYDWSSDESQMELLVDYARFSLSIYKLGPEINYEDREN